MADWKPMLVSHGFGCTKIDTPLTAVIFMDNLPGPKREEMVFEVAYNACKRAARGEVQEAAAHNIFETWARSAGLLLPYLEAHVIGGGVRAVGGMRR